MASKERLVNRCVCIQGIPGSVQNGEVVRGFLETRGAPAFDVQAVENQPFEWVALLRDHESARPLFMLGKTAFSVADQQFQVKVIPSTLCCIPDEWTSFPLPEEQPLPHAMDTSPPLLGQGEQGHPQQQQWQQQQWQQQQWQQQQWQQQQQQWQQQWQQQQHEGAFQTPMGAPGQGPHPGSHMYPPLPPGLTPSHGPQPPGAGPSMPALGVSGPAIDPAMLQNFLAFQMFMQQQHSGLPASGPGSHMHVALSSPLLAAQGGQEGGPAHLERRQSEPVLTNPAPVQTSPLLDHSRDNSDLDFTVLHGDSESASELGEELPEEERPAMLRVWDLPANISEDDLKYYFENRRKKGGGPVASIDLNKQKREAIITFEDKNAVEQVLQKAPHLLKDKAVKVARFHPGAVRVQDEEEEVEEEEEETPQRTVEMSGVPDKVSEEMIELYLENPKKGGGPMEDHNYDRERGIVTATFVKAEDARKFVSKKHVMNGKTMIAKLWVPPKPVPTYQDRLLISGVKETTTIDCLTNFLEAKIDCEPKEFICAEEPGVYMVVFKETPDIGKLRKVCQERTLEGARLSVSPVPISCTVKVRNLKNSTTKDSLELYFESKKKSHGGDVAEVQLLPDEEACLVTFEESEVALRVCAKEGHKLDGARLDVSLYHECLGPGGGCRPEDFKLPAPVELKQLDKYKLMYLRGTKGLQEALEKELKGAHVNICWPKKKAASSVRLECTLTPEVTGVRKLLRTWAKDAQDIFHTYMEDTIKVKRITVLNSLWGLVEEKLPSIPSTNREAVTLFVEKENASLIVAGVEGPVQAICDQLEKLIRSIEEELERQKRQIEETIDTLRPHQLMLLRAINYPNKAESKFPGLQARISDRGITFKGQHQDVKSAQVEMYQTVSDASSQKLTHLSPSQLALMGLREMKKYLEEKLQADKVVGVWEVQEKTLVIHACSDRDAVAVTDIIKQSLVEFRVDLEEEAQSLLNTPEWHDLIKQLHNRSPGVLKIVVAADQSHVQITSNDQVAHGVKEVIVNFLRENAIYRREIAFPRGRQLFLQRHRGDDLKRIMDVNRAYKVKVIWAPMATQFTITGTNDGVERVLQQLRSLAASVCYQDITLKRPGVQRLIDSDKGKDSLDHIERSCCCVISLEEESEVDLPESGGYELVRGIQINAVFPLPPSRKLYIAFGDITEIRADVIVNAANQRLDHVGGLAKAIVDKGGRSIQEECSAYVRKAGQVPEGDVMVSGPGKLPCKAIVHAVGPMWQGGRSSEETRLTEVIFKSLEEADDRRFTSIAIPAISSGIFGYPRKEATRTIVQAVKEHFKSQTTKSSINDIFLCTIDKKISEDFIDAAQQIFGEGQTPRRGRGERERQWKSQASSDADAKHAGGAPRRAKKSTSGAPADYKSVINISIIKGEIAKQRVDVIVNSTSKELNLSHGAVSKSMLAAGGAILQQECSQRYPSGVRLGEVAVTGPGNLACQAVFHTAIPQWSRGAEKVLVKLVETVLTNANGSGYQSLALPAMGTGQLGYPRDVVARCLFETISGFGKKNPQTTLTDVRIVLYHGDQATIKAFEAVEKGTQGQGNRTGRIFSQSGPSGAGHSVPSGGEGGFTLGNFQVSVKQGDITKEKADAIVNSTNDDLNLKRGAVSQAILRACGQNLVDECKSKAADMKKHKVVSTSAEGLSCKNIIHISGEHFSQDWKKAVIKCLKEAEKQQARSIALPLLGTAAYNSTPEDMAVSISDALMEFKSGTDSSLTDIRIVIFQQQMLQPFCTKLHECVSKGKGKGFLSSVKGFFNWVSGRGGGEAGASGEAQGGWSGPEVPTLPEVTLYVHAGDSQVMKEVKTKLQKLCDKEIMQKTVTEEELKTLEPTEVDHIVAVGVSHGVFVDGYDRYRGEVRLEGLPEDIMKTNDAIQKILRDRVRAEAERQQAEILNDMVQWKFVEITTTGQNRVDYDASVNAKIEKAYRDQKTTVRFKAFVDQHEEEYEIDFKSMVEYPVRETNNTVEVVRTDKVKGSAFEMPAHWTAMQNDEDLAVVPLQTSSQEYQTLVNQFGLGHTIIKVERIQNKTLYQQYTAKQQQMQSKQPGVQVEHMLWHGTASNAIFSINSYGFNRSYCGKNATAYGQGVYFAVNPGYSASNTYSVPNAQGHKHIYQARVLTGYVGPGNSSLRVPPVRQGQELYDCVADNPRSPSMYIIFNDTQAYPEYLITFQ